MKSNAARGLTGIEIVVVTALTMIVVALISPVISARGQSANPAGLQTGFLHIRPTRYQTEKVDDGLLFAVSLNPEVSNNALLEARKQSLILAGKIKTDSARCTSDVLMQSAATGLNAAIANASITKAQHIANACPVKLAVADVL